MPWSRYTRAHVRACTILFSALCCRTCIGKLYRSVRLDCRDDFSAFGTKHFLCECNLFYPWIPCISRKLAAACGRNFGIGNGTPQPCWRLCCYYCQEWNDCRTRPSQSLSIIFHFLTRNGNKGVTEVTGMKVNRGAGYGLEIPCVYRLYGPNAYIQRLQRAVEDIHT